MRPRPAFLVPALLTVLLLPATTASAGFDIDFGAQIRLNDQADIFLAVSSRYFGHDRAVVDSIAVRYRDPDDLAVSLFLARHAGQSPERIFRLRRQGLSWWDISVRFGLPVDIWFVQVRRDPGPPYGKAYGHWKKHKRDRAIPVVLTDVDARHLVAVRMIHEYYGVPVETAMEWRSAGRGLSVLVSEEYRRRHGGKRAAGPPKRSARSGHPGKGHGKKK